MLTADTVPAVNATETAANFKNLYFIFFASCIIKSLHHTRCQALLLS